MKEVKRDPVLFDYTGLNWDFIRKMARIPLHAAEKYGSWDQYKDARLTGEKSPINHAIDHLAKYMNGEPYDRWDNDVEWHLVAAAYNCMMEFFYKRRFGHVLHPLAQALKDALASPVPLWWCSSRTCDWKDASSHFERAAGEPCPRCKAPILAANEPRPAP